MTWREIEPAGERLGRNGLRAGVKRNIGDSGKSEKTASSE
jgi:hypothetical protein